jgi:hypothetical protein
LFGHVALVAQAENASGENFLCGACGGKLKEALVVVKERLLMFFSKAKKSYKLRFFFIFLVLIVIFSPILAYAYTFGFGIWASHDEWSKMGSALGGIYSPIIAVATLCFLYRQQRFTEISHAENREADFRRHTFAKCENYITLASLRVDKLDESQIHGLICLLEMYADAVDEKEKEEVFAALNKFYQPQILSIGRVSSTLHKIRDLDMDVDGMVTDLRMYASSVISLELLLAHDVFYRGYMNDGSYFSFEPSGDEKMRVDEAFDRMKKKK